MNLTLVDKLYILEALAVYSFNKSVVGRTSEKGHTRETIDEELADVEELRERVYNEIVSKQ